MKLVISNLIPEALLQSKKKKHGGVTADIVRQVTEVGCDCVTTNTYLDRIDRKLGQDCVYAYRHDYPTTNPRGVTRHSIHYQHWQQTFQIEPDSFCHLPTKAKRTAHVHHVCALVHVCRNGCLLSDSSDANLLSLHSGLCSFIMRGEKQSWTLTAKIEAAT